MKSAVEKLEEKVESNHMQEMAKNRNLPCSLQKHVSGESRGQTTEPGWDCQEIAHH